MREEKYKNYHVHRTVCSVNFTPVVQVYKDGGLVLNMPLSLEEADPIEDLIDAIEFHKSKRSDPSNTDNIHPSMEESYQVCPNKLLAQSSDNYSLKEYMRNYNQVI